MKFYSSIFHEDAFYVNEGKSGPDHPESRNMKSPKDFREKKNEEKFSKLDTNSTKREFNLRDSDKGYKAEKSGKEAGRHIDAATVGDKINRHREKESKKNESTIFGGEII